MIIYLYGLPGAGKSTISVKLQKKYNIPEIIISSVLERWAFFLIFALLHPVVTGRLLFIAIRENRHNPALLEHKIRKLFIHALAYRMKAKILRHGIVDEGLLQLLLSLYERPITGKDLSPFQHYVKTKKTEMVYIIIAPPDIRLARLKKRGRFPRQRFGMNYVLWLQKLFQDNSIIVEKFIKKNCRHKIIKNF